MLKKSNWKASLKIDWVLVAGFLAVMIIGICIGITYQKPFSYNQGIQFQRPISYKQGYDRGYQEAWKVGYTQGYSAGQAPYKSSTNTTISVERALAILAEGKSNHLAWATRPDLIARQDEKTGDTSFNLMWGDDYYPSIENLLKWQANEIILRGGLLK